MKLIPKNIGILGFLGPFTKHKQLLDKMNVLSTYVKTKEDLDSVDALIIPGAEVTSLNLALKEIFEELVERVRNGMPLFLTGEALLLLTESENNPLKFRKLKVNEFISGENKYYQENVRLLFSDTKDYKAHYIKSPTIAQITSDFTPLSFSSSDGEVPIIIQNNGILATTFYPEFSADQRIHEYFITLI